MKNKRKADNRSPRVIHGHRGHLNVPYSVLFLLFIAIFTGKAIASPERVVLTSSLTYRGDGQGAYLFKGSGKLDGTAIASDGTVEYTESPGIYELIIPYKTKDLISGITINWKFSGKVTMEVSATGQQLTYVPVTNGVPLEWGDFTSGTALKWRATLAPGSKLSAVKIDYTAISGIKSNWGTPELSGFKFRKPIYIKGTEAGALFNYQLPIKVGESSLAGDYDVLLKGPIQSNFLDVRFTQTDKETLLSFWRESIEGAAGNRTATFWVKIPQLPKNGLLIYLYYNKPNAEALSNGSGTFDFFDDFKQGLDSNKWQVFDFKTGILEYKLKTEQAVKTLDTSSMTNDELIKFFSETAKYEWMRVRQLANPKPQIDITKTETALVEVPNLATFDGVTVAGNGDLILDAEHTEGEYLSPVIYTSFPVRIMVPSWKAVTPDTSTLAADISATAVASDFKKDCINENYYYASKKDFKEGKSLKWKVRLGRKSISAATSRLQEFSLDFRPGTITLVKPDGKEIIKAGANYEIDWSAWEYEPSYKMKLEYSLDAGKTYNLLVKETENDGHYLWAVPNKLSDNALVKISDALDPTVYDVSNSTFFITKEGLTTSKPALEPSSAGLEEIAKAAEEAEAKAKAAALKLKEAIPEEEGRRPGTKLYDVLVKIGDNRAPDPKEDAAGCYKEGDVVAVRPAGYQWGAEERDKFLIVQLYLTEQEAQELTQPREIATGKTDESGRPIMETLRRRAKRIDLSKLGLFKGLEAGARAQELRSLRRSLKDKVLKQEVVEEK